jgi:hypothetical protein
MTRTGGFKSWPPRWTTTRHDDYDKPIGEVGTLDDVIVSDLIGNKVFMFIRYQGFRYMGFMSFDDDTFCSDIFTLLKANTGRSIKDIGDLDVSQLL